MVTLRTNYLPPWPKSWVRACIYMKTNNNYYLHYFIRKSTWLKRFYYFIFELCTVPCLGVLNKLEKQVTPCNCTWKGAVRFSTPNFAPRRTDPSSSQVSTTGPWRDSLDRPWTIPLQYSIIVCRTLYTVQYVLYVLYNMYNIYIFFWTEHMDPCLK